MPRARKPENRGYPRGWSWEHGAIYYSVPRGDECLWDGKRRFRLGRTDSEAHAAWAARVPIDASDVISVSDAMDRYLLEVTPIKAARSQKNDRHNAATIRPVFGHMQPKSVKPAHAYRYIDSRASPTGEKAPHAGGKEMRFLSAVLSACVQWGVIDTNPLIGNLRIKLGVRKVHTENAQIEAAQREAPAWLRAYIDIAWITGVRQADMLQLRVADTEGEGITVRPQKTANTSGVAIIHRYDESGSELLAAVQAAKAARPRLSPFLFCTRDGKPYWVAVRGESSSAFKSAWRRLMAKLEPDQRFKASALRKRAASDSADVEQARQRLGHTSPKTTQQHYITAPTVVPELRRKRD